MNKPCALNFIVSPAHAGYGARIWLHKEDAWNLPTLHGVLDGLSKWGGSDKESPDGMIAWEFGEACIADAVKACESITKPNEVEP